MLVALHQHDSGADDAFRVDAAVRIEILVFGGDERLLDQRRNCGGRQIEAPLARVFGQQAAVGGVDARHHRRLIVLQLAVVGEVLLELPDHRGDDASADNEDNRARREEKTKETGDAAHISIQRGPGDGRREDRPRANVRALLNP